MITEKKEKNNRKFIKVQIFRSKMKNSIQTSGLKKHTLVGGLSFFAGLLNGLVGTGGGTVLIFLFYLLRSGEKGDFKDDLVMTVISVIPMSIAALIMYSRSSSIDFSIIGRLFIPISLGGVGGAYLMDKIDKKWLTVIFSSLMIYSGIRMVISSL